jgi:hypothetical protein
MTAYYKVIAIVPGHGVVERMIVNVSGHQLARECEGRKRGLLRLIAAHVEEIVGAIHSCETVVKHRIWAGIVKFLKLEGPPTHQYRSKDE